MFINGIIRNEFWDKCGTYHYIVSNLYAINWYDNHIEMTREEFIDWIFRLDYQMEEIDSLA